MVPSYLSRGPPILQHPERVVPLSECERFEPHFQPNVALAPIPTPSITPVPPQPSASSLNRRNYHERRRSGINRPPSPGDKVVIKLEKPSTPIPEELVDENYSPDEESTPIPEHREEEESNTAVTSSTVTMELPAPEIGTSSGCSDSETEQTTTAQLLEEKLIALGMPEDVLTLAREVSNELSQLKLLNRVNQRELANLRNQRDKNQVVINESAEPVDELTLNDDKGHKDVINNANAADSTEGTEDKKQIIVSPTEHKEPDNVVASKEND